MWWQLLSLRGPNHRKCLPWDSILGSVYWERFHLWQQATISSPFKWHQTGGTLFQAYKWTSVQVLHLIHRRSQIRWQDKVGILQIIHNHFESPLKWLASLISLRPDGFKSLLLLKTLSPTARHTSRFSGSELSFGSDPDTPQTTFST